MRQHLGWVLTALPTNEHETDLIYEAYFDAVNVDLRLPGGDVT